MEATVRVGQFGGPGRVRQLGVPGIRRYAPVRAAVAERHPGGGDPGTGRGRSLCTTQRSGTQNYEPWTPTSTGRCCGALSTVATAGQSSRWRRSHPDPTTPCSRSETDSPRRLPRASREQLTSRSSVLGRCRTEAFTATATSPSTSRPSRANERRCRSSPCRWISTRWPPFWRGIRRWWADRSPNR
jgi:hypothetical protein